jgi:hypothetical protein
MSSLLRQSLAQYKDIWRPLIPVAGMGLVIVVLWIYVFYMRYRVANRWCDSNMTTMEISNRKDIFYHQNQCAWMRWHDAMAAYWGTMILFHYTFTVFRSPGVLLSTSIVSKNEQSCIRWSSWKGQGGILGLNAVSQKSRERQRADYFGKLLDTDNNNRSDDKMILIHIPNLQRTFCSKCHHSRPPRCRHCSTCQRCILQYDHHCIWVNQCIGYNNYRSFFLMMFYLTAGCWYGVVLMFHPVVESLYRQIESQGGLWNYLKGNYFMLIPIPLELLRLAFGYRDDDVNNEEESRSGRIEFLATSVVYLLMMLVGSVLLVFFTSHLRMTSKGRTTLDHILFRQEEQSTDASAIQIVNPFDQGSAMKNLQQVLGPNVLCWLLPIPVDPPLPYLPPPKIKKG